MTRLNIVVPMAGAGSRFAVAGYLDPKPLIKINGIPMIGVVVKNLRPKINHRFIFICQRRHVEEYNLNRILPDWSPGCEIVELHGLTEGAACTVLAASSLIETDEPLVIANSDQWIDASIDNFLIDADKQNVDGHIMTMTASDPKWSFVGFGSDGSVARVVEKEVISNEATVGIYFFRRGRDFISAAQSMIDRELRVNGEFYVAPAYNLLIEEGRRIGTFSIGSETEGMFGLGTPQDLEYFLGHPALKKATER